MDAYSQELFTALVGRINLLSLGGGTSGKRNKQTYNLPAGETVLTLELLLGHDIFAAWNPAPSSLYVPTMAVLFAGTSNVYDIAAPEELDFLTENRGTGEFAVNFAPGVTCLDPLNINPIALPRYIQTQYRTSGVVNQWVIG